MILQAHPFVPIAVRRPSIGVDLSSCDVTKPQQSQPSGRLQYPFGSWFTYPHYYENHDTTTKNTNPRLFSKRDDQGHRTVSECQQLRVHEPRRAGGEGQEYPFFSRFVLSGDHRSVLQVNDPHSRDRVQVDNESCRPEPEQRKEDLRAAAFSQTGAGTTSSMTWMPSFLPPTLMDPSTQFQEDDTDVGLPLDDEDPPITSIATSTKTRTAKRTTTNVIFLPLIIPDLHPNGSDSVALTMLHTDDSSMIFELDL